jgi:hypothetical protein
MEDLDRQILACGTEHLHVLLAENLTRAMVGIHDVVAELELDALDLAGRLELFNERCLINC